MQIKSSAQFLFADADEAEGNYLRTPSEVIFLPSLLFVVDLIHVL